MKALLPVLLAVLLTGCGLTPQGDAFRGAVAERGREAAAQGLENAEWYMCRASPVGAILDRYGQSNDRWDSYRGICMQRWAPATEATPVLE